MISKGYLENFLIDINSVKARLHEEDWEFQIWPIDKLNKWNVEYNVEDAIPGYYAFGSDGGLEMLIIELSTGIIYSIPFIPMEITERIKVSESLEELVNRK